jgi:hypothetical protein
MGLVLSIKFNVYMTAVHQLLVPLKSATTFCITTFRIMTLSIMGSIATLGVHDTRHTSIECCYDQCHDYSNVLLSVIMLSVVMLNVVMLNVIKLNVVILNAIMLNVIMLNVTMLNVVMLSAVMLSVVAASLK